MKNEDFPDNQRKILLELMEMCGIKNKIGWLYTKNKEPYHVTLVKKNNELHVENIKPAKEAEPEDLTELANTCMLLANECEKLKKHNKHIETSVRTT